MCTSVGRHGELGQGKMYSGRNGSSGGSTSGTRDREHSPPIHLSIFYYSDTSTKDLERFIVRLIFRYLCTCIFLYVVVLRNVYVNVVVNHMDISLEICVHVDVFPITTLIFMLCSIFLLYYTILYYTILVLSLTYLSPILYYAILSLSYF